MSRRQLSPAHNAGRDDMVTADGMECPAVGQPYYPTIELPADDTDEPTEHRDDW